MKVVHIISGLRTGGAERMLVKLLMQTKDQVDHVVISLKDGGDQGKYIKEVGIPVFEMNIKGLVSGWFSIKKLKRVIDEQQPDIIQGWMYHGNFVASLVSSFKSEIPIIFNVRHSLHNIKSETIPIRALIRINSLMSKRVSRIIYNSSVSKLQHEAYGFSSNRSIILPNGFEVNDFAPNPIQRLAVRKELKLSEDDFLFVQMGRNHPMKNHRGLIYAAAKSLNNQKKNNVYFLIVGKGVASDPSLKSLISDLKLEDKIFLMNERQDTPNIWNAADCGVLSSLWGEGFPNVIGEAMACAKPCIVTDVGDSAYVLKNNGAVVNPSDVDDMAFHLSKFSAMPRAEIKQLGEEARKRIVNNFSIEEISIKYLDLYKSVLSEERPS